jgi:hypothetical protein
MIDRIQCRHPDIMNDGRLAGYWRSKDNSTSMPMMGGTIGEAMRELMDNASNDHHEVLLDGYITVGEPAAVPDLISR